MAKTKIEWCDYTVNPVKGLCPMACPYCYARRMYKRFKWNPDIRFWQPSFFATYPKGSKVFIGSTMELFGDWIKCEWIETIFTICRQRDDVTWIFLTKQPENLLKWSPFPDNCWVGVSAVDKLHFLAACHYLSDVKSKVKFISFEPLLESMESSSPIGKHLMNGGINWVVIGRQTPASATTMPRIQDIQAIIRGANEIPIPVFLKNNLKGFLPFQQFPDSWKEVYKLRQEFPETN